MLLTRTRTASTELARTLILQGRAPEDLVVEGTLAFVQEPLLRRLPAGLKVRRLQLTDCPNIQALPEGLRVRHLEIRNCPNLTSVGSGLHCYELDAPASSFTELPEHLRVDFRMEFA